VLARGPAPAVVVIDGYVWLAPGRPGLGAHLYEALGRSTAVIGVAKTRFASATGAVSILRGGSQSPLYITAIGMDLTEAAAAVTGMHGAYRMPTLVKRVDQLARTSAATRTSI